jgi:hypothetical protein
MTDESELQTSTDATDAPAAGETAKKPVPRRSPNIRRLARAHAEAAVAALATVMADAKATPAARVSAASVLLNWGFGKPGGDGGVEEKKKERVIRLAWAGGIKT